MFDPKRYQPKELKQVKTDRQFCVLRFSPDGAVLAAGGTDGTIRRWDDQFAELPAVKGHGGFVQGLVFHPDGQRLFAADSWGQLRCWPFAEKEPKPLWAVDQAHESWVRGLALSPDGKTLASCGSDKKVILWSAEDGKKVVELPGHKDDVFCVAFHPDGQSLVSGDLKGVVKVWELPAGKVKSAIDAAILYRVDRLQDTGGVRFLGFEPKGSLLAVAGTQPKNGGNVQGVPTILLFDWASGKIKHALKVGTDGDGYVYEAHFHPDGFVMAVTSGNPGTGKLFFQRPEDVQPFFLATKMANCHSLAVHPNGQRLVVSATNANSAGNGRVGNGKDYPGNWSPLFVWELPKPA